MNELVSVIMPIFNGEKYLKEAIESILNQTFTDFEFIIIDDGSTDNSLRIIQSFDDRRIDLLKNFENKGIVYSLNKGITSSQGKYIARMDADDISLPNRFEEQLLYLEKHNNIDIIGGSVILINKNGIIRKKDIRKLSHQQINTSLLFTCPIYHPTILGRREVFMSLIYDNQFTGLEDWELWTRIIKQYKMMNIKTIVLKYRLHNDNATKLITTKKSQEFKRLFEQQLKYYFRKINNEDIEQHTNICSNIIIPIFDKNTIQNSIHWLMKLQNMNHQLQVFNFQDFDNNIKLAFFKFLNRNIKIWDFEVLRLIISNRVELTFKQKLFLIGKMYRKLFK